MKTIHPPLAARLVLDFMAACLLLFAMAYYWLGNAPHEIAGTALLLLVISHNVFNRRRYPAIARSPVRARQKLDLAIIAMLALSMMTLLITSLMISETVFGFLVPRGDFNARRVHAWAAYWALLMVSMHLGMRWPVIMSKMRHAFRITEASPLRTNVLRALTACLAIQGVVSSFELNLGTQLAMQISLDWWNFEESVIGFFLHCIAVAGLYIALAHTAGTLLTRTAFQSSNP